MLVYDVFFFKQKTAYEMRISDWSSDVCSSDLASAARAGHDMVEGQVLRPEVVATVLALEGVAQEDVKSGEGGAAVQADVLLQRDHAGQPHLEAEIGRASCRERVCTYV